MKEYDKVLMTDFLGSNALRRLVLRCNRPTILDILGKKDSETCHSSMLAWIFSESDFKDLPVSAPQELLRLISAKAREKGIMSETASTLATARVKEVYVDREKPLGNKGRIDLYIEILVEGGHIFRVWIENKLFSPLDEGQLSKYHGHIDSKRAEENVTDYFVYLSPEKGMGPGHGAYVHITYQELYDHILFPVYEQSEILGRGRSSLYLKEYLDALTSYGDTYSPIVKSRDFLEDLREVYDKYFGLYAEAVEVSPDIERCSVCGEVGKDSVKESLSEKQIDYSGVFESAVREFGTEAERKRYGRFSRSYRLQIGDCTETVLGYAKLARKVFELLLRHKHEPADLLRKLGRLENKITGFDSNIADNKHTKQADSRYSKGTIRRSGIYVSNQWSADKARYFIGQVGKYYPGLKIFQIK